jgi:hypothetical protein
MIALNFRSCDVSQVVSAYVAVRYQKYDRLFWFIVLARTHIEKQRIDRRFEEVSL